MDELQVSEQYKDNISSAILIMVNSLDEVKMALKVKNYREFQACAQRHDEAVQRLRDLLGRKVVAKFSE